MNTETRRTWSNTEEGSLSRKKERQNKKSIEFPFFFLEERIKGRFVQSSLNNGP
jgi:hypothetical protein